MSQGLKAIVKQIISKDVFEEDRARNSKEWKVLVMDDQSTRVISSCCKMFDIMNCRVTLVEDIKRNREPLEKLDAIYLVKPTEDTVNRLIQDFTPAVTDNDIGIKYRNAHVFFTEPCSDALVTKMAKSKAVRFIKTLKEINVAFLPYESQVFTLDLPEAFSLFYQEANVNRDEMLELMADRLATVCVTLGEYPSIRYRIEHQGNIEFAKILQQKLDKYKKDDPSLGEGGDKNQSQLLILDRGFDPVSPLMHELTYQAMAYDLVDIEKDIYKRSSRAQSSEQQSNDNEAMLDEKDELWAEFRHQHIADVLKKVAGRFKEFANSHKDSTGDQPTLKDLSQMLKKMPEYKKEINSYSLHLSLADDCMKKFNSDRMKRMCEAEQNLALGSDTDGEKIKDPLKQIVPSLLDTEISVQDKLRLIMLFVLNNNGITNENLQKLFQNADIEELKKQIVLNMSTMGMQILVDNAKQARKKIIPANRKEREPQTYQLSRWTPFVKDLMEDVADDKLDQRMFPYLNNNKASASSGGAMGMLSGTSARPTWNRNQGMSGATGRSGPRLIVFVIGGLTYSEMRTAYEVTAANKRWEVIIGSDQILTPKKFLQNLETAAGANQTEA